jgi:hypothetical protein
VRRCLPDRKRSADIINRYARYAEREAAANQGDQHGGFRAIDLSLVDKLARVGNGNSPWNESLGLPCLRSYAVFAKDVIGSKNSGSVAIFAAIRRASSFVSSLAVHGTVVRV